MPQPAMTAPALPAAARSYAVPAFVAMLGSQVLTAAAGLAAPVLAPLAAADIGLQPYLIGYYVSLMYGAAATAGLLSGGLIARWGAVRLTQACLLISGGSLVLAVVGTPAAVAISAVILGIGYGPMTPASSHILARTTPAARLNFVFSLKQTGVPLGFALAGAVLPGLALAIGWRLAALGLTAVCAVAAVAIQPLQPHLDTDRQPRRRLISLEQAAGPLRLVMSVPALRLLALTSFAFAGMQATLATFLVTYLNHGLGMPLVAAGFALSCAQAGGVTGRIGWGYVADRLAAPTRVLGGLGLGMTTMAALVAAFDAGWPFAAIAAVCIVFGGTAAAWNGVHLAQLARHAPSGRAGEVTGGATFLTFGGVTVIPFVFSSLLALSGSYAIGYLSAATLTLASAAAFLLSGRSAGSSR